MKSNLLFTESKVLFGLSKEVEILCKKKGEEISTYAPDGILHIFVLRSKANFIKNSSPYIDTKTFKWQKCTMATALYLAMEAEFKGVMIHGILKHKKGFQQAYFSLEDIKTYSDAILIAKYIQECNEGNISPDIAIHNLIDKYFYYYKDKNGQSLVIDDGDEEKGEEVLLHVLVFSNRELLIDYLETNNIDYTAADCVASTLRNILQSLPSDIGAFIDIGTENATAIARFMFEDALNGTSHNKSRFFAKDRLEYYSYLDEFYVILDDTVSAFNSSFPPLPLIINEKDTCLYLFENYEEALRFANINLIKRISNFHPIGKVNSKEVLEKLLRYSKLNGINNIKLDYGTINASELNTNEAYEQLFAEKCSKTVPALKIKPYTPAKNILSNKRTLFIETLRVDDIPDFLITANSDEIMFLINSLKERKSEINQKDFERLYSLAKYFLYKDLTKEAAVFIDLVDENVTKIYSNDNDIQTTYQTAISLFNSRLFEILKTKEIILSNGNGISVSFTGEELSQIAISYDSEEDDRDRLIFHLVFVRGFSYSDAEIILSRLYLDKEKYDKYLKYILEPSKYEKELKELHI